MRRLGWCSDRGPDLLLRARPPDGALTLCNDQLALLPSRVRGITVYLGIPGWPPLDRPGAGLVRVRAS